MLILKSFCMLELLAHIICEEFVNAMSLYWQEKVLEVIGGRLPRTKMANWIIYTAKHRFRPIFEDKHWKLLKLPVIPADETVV